MLISQMEGDIDDNTLESQIAAVVEQSSFDQPGCLVVQQRLPPVSRYKLGQNYCGLLSVIMLLIRFIQEIQQGLDK